MIRNIFAFTEPQGGYPGYISINDRHGDEVAVSIRSKAQPHEFGGMYPGNQAELVLDREQLTRLRDALTEYLSHEP